jgi:hypothetical protein
MAPIRENMGESGHMDLRVGNEGHDCLRGLGRSYGRCSAALRGVFVYLAGVFLLDCHDVFFVPREGVDHLLSTLLLALFVEILHCKEGGPAAADEGNVHRISFLPARCFNNGEYSDGIEREHSPAGRKHTADRYRASFCIVPKCHVYKWHENRCDGSGNTEEIVTGDFERISA